MKRLQFPEPFLKTFSKIIFNFKDFIWKILFTLSNLKSIKFIEQIIFRKFEVVNKQSFILCALKETEELIAMVGFI